MADKRTMSPEEKIKSDEQRLDYLSQIVKVYERNKNKSARNERTHLLCQIGGSMLKHFPDLDTISPDEINDFIYHMSRLSDVDELYKHKLDALLK